MEVDVLPKIVNFRLYKKSTITISTFLAGPLVGGYFIAENFKHFGEENNANKTWICTALAVAFIIGTLFIPGIENIPSIIFPIIYSGIATYLTQKYQENKINDHEKNGGLFFPFWRVAIASLTSITILFIMIFAALFMTNQISF
ncbi:MAG: hypothetical protein V4561_05905 [Bacteroidota bacterium]